jgi:hypothetical protein
MSIRRLDLMVETTATEIDERLRHTRNNAKDVASYVATFSTVATESAGRQPPSDL